MQRLTALSQDSKIGESNLRFVFSTPEYPGHGVLVFEGEFMYSSTINVLPQRPVRGFETDRHSKETPMRRNVALLAIMSMIVLQSAATWAQASSDTRVSALLMVTADGIGDLSFASPEWVEAAQEALTAAATRHADGLKDLGEFTLCEVAHNPPAYLHAGSKVAWYVKFNGSKVEAHTGELPADQCDLKIQGDHSIMSNLGRIQYHGNDPAVIAAAQARLQKLSRWEIDGSFPEHKVLGAVLRSLHDTMAVRTLPRFVWMSPEWVESARRIVSARAKEFADGITDVEYTFNEVFTDAPAFAFPDGLDSGFWVHCSYGEITVGYGPVPEELSPPDYLNKLLYNPVVPVGRTVNAAMTDEDKAGQAEYSAAAFGVDTGEGNTPIRQSDPSKNKPMPAGLGKVMAVLHDELSKRSSGELPSDYDDSIRLEWATPYAFDRDPGYDASWLLYDQFDIYGNPR